MRKMFKTYFNSSFTKCVSKETRGQSTLEYALTLFAFLNMLVTLGLIASAANTGVFSRLLEEVTSHGIETALADIFLY